MNKKHKIAVTVLTIAVAGGVWNMSEKLPIDSQGKEEIVTIHMGITRPSGNIEDFDQVMEQVNNRTREQIGVELQIDFIDSDERGLLKYLTEQTEADLICVSDIQDKVNKNMLLPLDELIREEGEAITQVIEPEYLELGKVDGVQYAVALNRDMAEAYGVSMRQDLLEKYEIDWTQIQTWDDFEDVLEIITKKEPIYGVGADTLRPFDRLGNYLGVLMSDEEEMKVVNYYETEEFYDWISRIRSWKEKGYLYEKEALSYKSMNSRPMLYELVKEGELFSYIVKYKPGIDAQESKSTGRKLVTVMLEEPVMTTESSVASQYGIYSGSRHPKEAMKMLNFLYEDEAVANLLCWGIEGEHYQKNEDGTISYPEGKGENEIGYNFNLNWVLPNPYLAYAWEGDSLNLEEELEEFNKTAKKSPALGFVFDETEVSIECEVCEEIVEQYLSGFLCGAFEIDKMLPKMIQELEEGGIELIIQEKQRQLDEWKENKNHS